MGGSGKSMVAEDVHHPWSGVKVLLYHLVFLHPIFFLPITIPRMSFSVFLVILSIPYLVDCETRLKGNKPGRNNLPISVGLNSNYCTFLQIISNAM